MWPATTAHPPISPTTSPAKGWRSRSPTTPTPSPPDSATRNRRWWSTLPPFPPTTVSSPGSAKGDSRWSSALWCSASSPAAANRSASRAPTAKPPPRRWPPTSSRPRVSAPTPSSAAFSATIIPTSYSPRRRHSRWSRPTNSTGRSISSPPGSPWSPPPTPTISTSTAPRRHISKASPASPNWCNPAEHSSSTPG